MRNNTHFASYLAHFFLERKVSDQHCWETQNTHFMFNFVFSKSCRLWENVDKYCKVGQATDDNMAYVLCMLDTKGCKYTQSGCIIFIAATTVTWMYLIITLYVHCMSFLHYIFMKRFRSKYKYFNNALFDDFH